MNCEMNQAYRNRVAAGEKNSTAYLDCVVKSEPMNPNLTYQLKHDFKGVYLEIAKLELHRRGVDIPPLEQKNFQASLHRVRERLDCGDFVIPGFLTILYRYRESPLLDGGILGELEEAVLGFKYWIDEPGVDIHLPCYFTENHQILFHSIEYLAGQLYGERTFSNGENGRWHREHARTYLERWLTWRTRFGFSEWLSNSYYAEDLLGLCILSEFAEEEPLRLQAAMLTDLLLFDIALHSHKGAFCSTSGRMYNAPTMDPALAGINAVAALLFGEGYIDGGLSPTAVLMAARDYRCAGAVRQVALDRPLELENRQRMSINVEDSGKYGIDPADFDNILLYWSLHTFHHRLVIENSRRFCPEWYNMDASIAANLEKYRMLEAANVYTDPDPNGSALTQADTYTYRTPNYMLSCTQNYRKGRTNFQQHIWQATLGGRALSFVTHPGSNDYTGRPNYFVGNGIMPRVHAHKNVLVAIHRIPAESTFGYRTHAYFPTSAFDEFDQRGGWLFGRKGEGYLGLYSLRPGNWCGKDPALFQSLYHDRWEDAYERTDRYDYMVPGHANVWICEMGEPRTHGSFAEFCDALMGAEIAGDTFGIRYASPSQGLVEAGWEMPFRVDGREICTGDYPRYDNPYCHAAFDAKRYDISCGGRSLSLDFAAGTRTES